MTTPPVALEPDARGFLRLRVRRPMLFSDARRAQAGGDTVFGISRMYEQLSAGNRGQEHAVFRDDAAAVAWLLEP